MERLDTQAAIDALCERFSDFFDAVLVEVVLQLPPQARDRQATLRLLAQDREETWWSVRLVLSSLSGYRLTEGRVSYLVLSDGLHIALHDQRTVIDLAPDRDQVRADTELEQSQQYVVGGECRYEIGAADW